VLFDRLGQALTRRGVRAAQFRLGCGDVALAVMADPSFEKRSGVVSCGILCSHLSETSLAACDQLGAELARIYASARLATGHSGAMQYRSYFL
jgi:hypothetical protein